MGFSVSAAQGLSTPPYLIAMLLMYVEGWVGDRMRQRGPVVLFNAILCTVGLCLMTWTAPHPASQYVGAVFVTSGASSNIPAVMVYESNNIRGAGKRAFASAQLITFGALGGIAGSLVFRAQDAPRYIPGIVACIV